MTSQAPLGAFDFDRDGMVRRFGDGAAVEYLIDYLGDLHATAVLEEHHYVDRHYLDEYANYYAKSFAPPEGHCRRYHFFHGISWVDLDAKISAALSGDVSSREGIERELNALYLGFVVRRPLDAATLGRTVLRTYGEDRGRRRYEVVRRYDVNVCGIRLAVRGLAYQQQDRGAAVCASSSLWSALQQVAALDGQKTPTPWAITQAAGSPYPASHGLDELQMATALNKLGFIADRFVPGDNLPLFKAKLIACLESHLPVVLLLTSTEGAGEHAVTVTGFSAPITAVDVYVGGDPSPIAMRGGSARTLYVHDDNLGSHAHYELEDSTDDPKNLLLFRGRKTVEPPSWHDPDSLVVYAALVPKPPKLRLPVESLFYILLHLRFALEDALSLVGVGGLEYRPRFMRGVQYRDKLFAMDLDPGAREYFHRKLSLPRNVAVFSAYDLGTRFLDVVIDVTSVPRDDRRPQVLAVVAPGVPAETDAHAAVRGFAELFNAPHITAASLVATGGAAAAPPPSLDSPLSGPPSED